MYRYQFLKTLKVGNAYIRANALVSSKRISPIEDAYVGEYMIDDDRNEVPAYAVFNGGIDYEYKKMTIAANVYNVFNTKYYQGVMRKSFPLPQQSFSFLMRLVYKF